MFFKSKNKHSSEWKNNSLPCYILDDIDKGKHYITSPYPSEELLGSPKSLSILSQISLKDPLNKILMTFRKDLETKSLAKRG